MNKLFKLFICCLMVLSFCLMTGCNDDNNDDDGVVDTLNDKTPEQLYQEAMDTVKNLKNYTTISEQEITMQMNGTTITTRQTVTSKLDYQDSYAKIHNDAVTQANMQCWYVNEWMYIVSNGQKYKARISYEKMQEQFMPEGSSGSDALMNLPQSWFKDIEFKLEENNTYSLEFIVSGDEYLKYMSSTSLGSLLNGVDDVTYKVYFNADGSLGDITTEFDYVVNGYNCHAFTTTKIKDINKTSITPPYGDFIDITGQI